MTVHGLMGGIDTANTSHSYCLSHARTYPSVVSCYVKVKVSAGIETRCYKSAINETM